ASGRPSSLLAQALYLPRPEAGALFGGSSRSHLPIDRITIKHPSTDAGTPGSPCPTEIPPLGIAPPRSVGWFFFRRRRNPLETPKIEPRVCSVKQQIEPCASNNTRKSA
uniref:Uncharacterized protein n=1 Tax=Anopheles dirus TaxID=7168 RepID=A0A182NX75_9DIPT